jgi:hypothetical protein
VTPLRNNPINLAMRKQLFLNTGPATTDLKTLTTQLPCGVMIGFELDTFQLSNAIADFVETLRSVDVQAFSPARVFTKPAR